MKHMLSKLFFGKPEYNTPLSHSAYRNLKNNFKRIWDNEKHNDIGFEKILRLFLVAVLFIFPGLHIRNYFGKKGLVYRNVAIEFYVLLKTLLPVLFLISGLYKYHIIVYISCYLVSETIFYVASLIFVADMFVKPRSYRRNILMLFFNYLENLVQLRCYLCRVQPPERAEPVGDGLYIFQYCNFLYYRVWRPASDYPLRERCCVHTCYYGTLFCGIVYQFLRLKG